MKESSKNRAGKVYLVGAGPGDPGLFTLKGDAILMIADVVLYDYLANTELLLHTKPGAELIYVGFHAEERMSQEAINQLLVEKARQGKTVCRLKGGDPFVFARGGEEAEHLAAADIPWEVVPGVSAGTAVPAYAGIPLTHRQLSSSVLFVTGHEDPEKPGGPDVEWEKIAHGASTLVFFMGVKTLPQIAENLIRAGRPFSTPVAIIRWGTKGEQQTLTGTLATIVERARAAGVKPPALAVVGDVVRLREKLQWFERLPLFGQRILITRPREQAAELVAPLRALGAETLELPTIAIEDPEDWAPLDKAIRYLRRYHWVIFTSANGVRKFLGRMAARGNDIRSMSAAKLCAIGPATAAELRRNCLKVDVVPKEYVAEGVVKALAKTPLRGRRVLIPRARVARDLLPEALRKRGASVDVVEAYRSVLPPESVERARVIFERHKPTVAVFTSSSAVSNLFRLLPEEEMRGHLRDVKVASIGPVTSRTAREHGLQVAIQPRQYTVPALVRAITNSLTAVTSKGVGKDGE
ncbi:MAG: uroporphyrinogen-III C-methyltransferase [Acidobacteria bacterium RIFCSPLOWO2_02_FULL_60_20]|nr:MAG: uroporphyrinogen-III C-methyltransferase [Acidobacteria bacterium RIFCSPLOWO2_02_FULL_60_20]